MVLELLNASRALPVTPEIALAIAAIVLLMLGVFAQGLGSRTITSLAVIALAFVSILVAVFPNSQAFAGAVQLDPFARVMKLFTLFGAAASLVLSSGFMRDHRIERPEFPVLVLLSVVGMMMMISASDLIAVYMGLELQSLALYVVASIDRENARSSEAGLKYFVLGALSSGMLLYGASLIYGFTGTTNFSQIATAVQSSGASLGLIFGLVFFIAGLAFKVSAVPFHMWTPDVYEGSPTPVTAFFAAAPKVAAMAVFTRAMITPFHAITPEWQQVIVFIAIASMVLGAFAAIGQTNIKRLLAYSSIGHVGYALTGLAAGSVEGVRGVVIYMALYMAMTLGAFACVIAMRRTAGQVETISDLAGLARSNKWLAFLFAALMFSLAGIPPLAGFWSKYFVFVAAIKANLVALAVIGALSSVVSAFYYLRIVKIMYFDAPGEGFLPAAGEVRLVMWLSGAVTLGFVVWPAPLLRMAEAAAASLF